jgi:hypothetical protein
MQTKGVWGMLIAVGIVLCLGGQVEAQLAKQGN